MKFNKIVAAMLAIVAFAFVACKNDTDVIKLKLNKMSLKVGETYTIPVEKTSGTIAWASSAPAVATVNEQGTVTAVAEGSAAITATVGKAVATVDVTVANDGGGEGGAPDLDAPAQGKLKVVIEIPAGSECNGIALKGTFDGSEWSNENTYLGEAGAQTPVDGAIYKFTKVEGYANWFQVEVPAAEGMEFKVCLIYTNDGSWEGQAKDVELHSCNFSNIEPTIDGGQCKEIGANGGLLYLKIGAWNKSECVQTVLVKRHVVLTVPTNDCGAEVPSIVGSFNSWNATEIPMTAVAGQDGKYEATVEADASDEFKFAGSVSGWDNEIRVYDAENDELKDNNPNIQFGDQTEFAIDYSTGKWKKCEE
ncbi:MAG: Ig-like domain-containing protein [Paludibacteraceae bacterium]|nr:Ig-like domain-containing protein [Paludibacteraceae bacterium]